MIDLPTEDEPVRILVGDCVEQMRALPDGCVQTCVTSPPYYGLRDYGHAGQIGLESTPAEYVTRMVEVFREVRRVLRDDGTVWLNLGDSYGATGGNTAMTGGKHDAERGKQMGFGSLPPIETGLRPKNLLGIPWRVAFALQADGWYLRQDIIWCLRGGAWVYARTLKGEMPVMVKDLVRLNPANVQLWNGTKWTQVLGWGRNPDPAERLELVLRSGERIGCTGSHLWPTQRGNVRASELVAGDVIETCQLPEPEGAVAPGHLTSGAAWLLGLYLAEGSRADDTIQLSLCADEQHWISRLEVVAAHYGGSLTHTVSGNNLSVRMYGRILVALLEEYIGGRAAKDKHLKVAAWRLPNATLREVAQGYLDGDGSFDKKNNRYRLGLTRNYNLERDLRTLAARLGACLTLAPCKSSCQTGTFAAFRGEWRWERAGHWNEKDRGEVVEIRASRARQFWDISVEDEPHLFALSSGVLTHNCKPNPMPESVRDRCTKAHEYVFLLSKRDRYFYDADAVKENVGQIRIRKGTANEKLEARTRAGSALCASDTENRGFGRDIVTNGRNRRSVWTVTPKPFKGAHFAVMPPELVRPCVRAGSSERGACPHCGAPWVRHVERDEKPKGRSPEDVYTGQAFSSPQSAVWGPKRNLGGNAQSRTVGFSPSCECPAHEPVPCVVLDPFGGSGTTALVALEEGRRAVLCELNPEYAEMARKRVADKYSAGLFA